LTPVFFTDRDLGKRFPEILSAAGLQVERHADHFAPDASDEEWLALVGSRGWVAVSHDRRIRYKPNELGAVVRHNVRLLIVIGKAPFPDLARNFVASIGQIEAFLDVQKPPLIGKVYRPSPSDLVRNPAAAGAVLRWYP
jgi:hypothetical protein